MKTRFIITAAFLLLMGTLSAQSLGDFDPKENRGAQGPRKFPSKDIYIANFSVNFQLYNLKTTTNKGGFSDRMLTGSTKASLTVGLDIPTATLQQITDDAYQTFVADLKAQGFNVLNAEAAANTKYYEEYQLIENMEMSVSEAPGVLTVYPSNTPFYVKGFSKDGQKIQGGVSGFLNRAMNEDGRNSIVDEISTYTKLSNELNDATIVHADMYVLYLDIEKPYQGDGAKIIANTDLRLVANEHLRSRVSNNSNAAKMGLSSSTKEKYFHCVTAIDFIAGRNKIGGSPLGTYSGVLKKDLQIKGVVAEEKIEAFAKTSYDFIGSETAFGKMYQTDNISVENTALIRTNADKYEKGVKMSIDTFLNHHVREFKKKFFK